MVLAWAVLAVCCTAVPAGAHTNLRSASPAPNSSTKGTPAQVQLHFGQPNVPGKATKVSVIVPSGRDIARGPAFASGMGVSQPLRKVREMGWYRVRYTVVFVDGHVGSGVFRFRVTTFDAPPPSPVKWFLLLGGVTLLFFTVTAREAVRRARSGLAADVRRGSENRQPLL